MKYRREIAVFLFYALLAVVFTYPLIFKLGTSVYGYPGDNFGTIWHIWWNKYALTHDLPTKQTPFLNAPWGKDLGVGANSAVLYAGSMTGLSLVVGEVAAFNIINFISFPLAAFLMFLLVKHLTKNFWAAILSGLIFSFSPYHFWKAYNHADLSSIQWLPLYIYCLVRLFEKRNYRWAFLTAASFTLVALMAFYYGYFMILFTVGFVLTYLTCYRHTDIKRMVKVLVPTGVLAVGFLLPFTYKLFLAASSPAALEAVPGRGAGLLKTTTDELLSLSSRPWDFLLPSGHHPIFGKYVDQFYGWLARVGNDFKTQSAFSWERNIYLGWVGILLSLYALWNFRRSKKWIPIFTLLAILMVWISCPAFINISGHRWYFPSYFLHNFAPMFRTYVRLGVVVLLCVSVLAGFGFKFLLEKVRSHRGRILLTIFAFCILHFEFLNFPPSRVTTFEQAPPVYQWLKNQSGDFIIAEYPQPYSEAEAMFFQRIHQKRMVSVGQDLAALYDPEVVGKLRGLGVKYVVVHVRNIFPSDPYNGSRTYQIMSPPRESEGFRIVRQFDEALVYGIETD